MTTVCPACGQLVFVRHGVKLQPKQAAILDAIEKRRAGIALDTLAGLFYPDVETPRARQRIKVHVSQINDRLVSVDRRIVRRDGRYCFEAAP